LKTNHLATQVWRQRRKQDKKRQKWCNLLSDKFMAQDKLRYIIEKTNSQLPTYLGWLSGSKSIQPERKFCKKIFHQNVTNVTRANVAWRQSYQKLQMLVYKYL
jgi:hypothetical protein